MTNKYELHEERLATTDEYGHRVFLFPEEVKGLWRKRRSIFYWFLIVLYLILPWIYIGGAQSIKLDIANREFTFFSYVFYANNAPLLLFLFLGFVFTIGLITSIWGRVWCGWACPQTVFIDTIYRKIEIFAEGNPRQRQKLEESKWNLEKFFKRSVKWILYIVVSLHISHTFLGYFVGTYELVDISFNSPMQNQTLFYSMLIITLIILVDFGWFREQFCIIACPYGRFQSVMMDEQSLAIVYDEKRGEPRRQHGQKKEEHADCVNCYACVKACPTGIDIRRGVQLECIACTNCIDACDDIMLKTNRAPGLIRYDSQANIEGKKISKLRPRNIVYLIALLAIFIGLIFSIKKSTEMSVTVLKGLGSPYTILKSDSSDKNILNLFQITLDQSGTLEDKKVLIEVVNQEELDLEVKIPRNPYILTKHHARVNVFIKFNSQILVNGSRKVTFKITDVNQNLSVLKEASIVGPIN